MHFHLPKYHLSIFFVDITEEEKTNSIGTIAAVYTALLDYNCTAKIIFSLINVSYELFMYTKTKHSNKPYINK